MSSEIDVSTSGWTGSDTCGAGAGSAADDGVGFVIVCVGSNSRYGLKLRG